MFVVNSNVGSGERVNSNGWEAVNNRGPPATGCVILTVRQNARSGSSTGAKVG